MNIFLTKSIFFNLSKPSTILRTTLIIITLLFSFQLKYASATTLNIEELGQYDFSYHKVEKVKHVSGSHALAQVVEKQGSNFSVFLPFSVQQVNYLVANGNKVLKNQSIAYLKGYDVHHFLDEFDVSQQLYLQAKAQYESSKRLFKSKALAQSAWLDISKNYFQAQLRFEHLNHFKSFLKIDENENISIISPINGFLRYTKGSTEKKEGELLFDIIPTDAVRLSLNVPAENISNLGHLEIADRQCSYFIDTKEKIVNQFLVTVWSQSIYANDNLDSNLLNANKLAEGCSLQLGENVVVTPVYDQSAYRIEKSAVFEFENKDYIAVKNKQQLQLIEIDLVNSTATDYIFISQLDLLNKSVLVTSVSALQGILLALGGE